MHYLFYDSASECRSCKTQRWPYFHSAYIMQSNRGLWTVLMKPTAFQCRFSCLGKQTSASQINEKTGEPRKIFRSQAWMLFSLSGVLAECIMTLNRSINQSCVLSGYECRLLMGLRHSLRIGHSFTGGCKVHVISFDLNHSLYYDFIFVC